MIIVTRVLRYALICSKIALNVCGAILFMVAAKFIANVGNWWIFWFT